MLSPMLLTPPPGHLEQCRGRYDMKRKTAQIRGRLTEKGQDERCRDASALRGVKWQRGNQPRCRVTSYEWPATVFLPIGTTARSQCRKVGSRRRDQVLHYSRSSWIIGDSRGDAVPQQVGFQLGTTAALVGRAHRALSRLVDCLPRFAAIVRRT